MEEADAAAGMKKSFLRQAAFIAPKISQITSART